MSAYRRVDCILQERLTIAISRQYSWKSKIRDYFRSVLKLTLRCPVCRDPVANSRDPLAKAILRAYLAKKQILSGDLPPSSLEDCAQLCKKSGIHLAESINLGSSLHHSGASRLHQLAQLLCCDWLLGTRKDIWEFSQKPHPNVPVDPVELRSFQNDLDCLQKITHNLPAALPRVRHRKLHVVKCIGSGLAMFFFSYLRGMSVLE